MSTRPVKVSKRNQITLPLHARTRLNIKSGDRLLLDVQDGMIILSPLPANYTRALAGLYSELWNAPDQYILRERNAWKDAAESQG